MQELKHYRTLPPPPQKKKKKSKASRLKTQMVGGKKGYYGTFRNRAWGPLYFTFPFRMAKVF